MATTNSFSATYAVLFFLLVAVSSASSDEYRSNPSVGKPKVYEENLLSTIIGIQGIINCQNGTKFSPVEGAVARITCGAVDGYGFEAEPFSILSDATDSKGYFLATLSPYEVKDTVKLKECNVYLALSPLDTCNVPTDVNKGISGSLLASYRFLKDKKMKLFTVGPFFFTPETKNNSSSNGY